MQVGIITWIMCDLRINQRQETTMKTAFSFLILHFAFYMYSQTGCS